MMRSVVMRSGERFNSISHLVGAALAVVGLIPLAVVASEGGEARRIVSFAVYGVALVLLYLMSTLYHGLHGRAKDVFRRLDHIAIYLLIAGTYTPFALVVLGGSLGWTILAAVWSLALVGTLLDALRRPEQSRALQIGICLAMGWMCLGGIREIVASLPAAGFAWLLAGGVLYTVGVVFFVLDRRIRHGHGIWHLFVLAGSTSHYVALIAYV
jgi:hemolysin III